MVNRIFGYDVAWTKGIAESSLKAYRKEGHPVFAAFDQSDIPLVSESYLPFLVDPTQDRMDESLKLMSILQISDSGKPHFLPHLIAMFNAYLCVFVLASLQ